MTVNINVNGSDIYTTIPMDGRAHAIDLGTVNAGTHKFDIWGNCIAVVAIYEY